MVSVQLHPLTIRPHSVVHLLLLVLVHHVESEVRCVLVASRERQSVSSTEDLILVLEEDSKAIHQGAALKAPTLLVVVRPPYQFLPSSGSVGEARCLPGFQLLSLSWSPGSLPHGAEFLESPHSRLLAV